MYDFMMILKRGDDRLSTTKSVFFIVMITAFAALNARAQAVPGYNMGGYLGPEVAAAPAQYDAGFSLYSAAFPLVSTHPNDLMTGLIGTWYWEENWQPNFPYSDIEGGLGWWQGGAFPAASPKFGIGAVAPNWSGFANETGIRSGVYGFVHLSPRLLNPLDAGINLSTGTFGQLFGYGYLALPLTEPKSTTNGVNVPTGNHCWTLFLNTGNFKGPVGFVAPYFFTQWISESAANEQFAGLLLDSQWGTANRSFAMETDTIDAFGAADGSQIDVRTQPIFFPANGPNNSSILMHQASAYDQTLWNAVDQWLNNGGSAPSLPFTQGNFVKTVSGGGQGWGLWGPADLTGSYNGLGEWATLCNSYSPDPTTWGCQWDPTGTTLTQINNGSTVGAMVELPQYFQSINATNTNSGVVNWNPLPAASVPASTGLAQVSFPGSGTLQPVIVDTSGSWWSNPGPAAGPFATLLQDGSIVTYYWYRFEDQPAMQNAGLTQAERDQMQAKIVKLHTAWTSNLDYLPPPTVGTLANVDPGLLLTPPQGLEVGYVPIPVRQEWYGSLGNHLQQSTVTNSGQVTVTFTSGSGTWEVPTGVTSAEVLVVGGGGGGGAGSGGGGGSGAVVHYASIPVSGSVPVSVGSGGVGGVNNGAAPTNGGVSLFADVVAFGGGSGGSVGSTRDLAAPGASGGGGFWQFGTPGSPILNQGFSGGQMGGGSTGFAGAGGGGAGSAGSNAFNVVAGSAGGSGVQYSTSGTASWYGGGGGGGADYQRGGTSGGAGGSGGGGTGAAGAAAQAGVANTGGGGGAGSNNPSTENGAAGGSGVVIVRYSTSSGGSSSASYIGADIETKGNWTKRYGADGQLIPNDLSKPPSYANVTFANERPYTWAANSTDPRALQVSSGATSRIASTYYNATGFTINVNLTDGNAHRVALYLCDWNAFGRAETITIFDAASQAVLSKQSFSSFQGGKWESWNIQGNVQIQVETTAGPNAIVNGIFFDAAATSLTSSATYTGADVATIGNWGGKYGADGELIPNDLSNAPFYAEVTFGNELLYTWDSSTADLRALQVASNSSSRIASTYYSSSAFNVNMYLTDGNTHKISLYLCDWTNNKRAETITIVDANSQAVLSQQTFSGFYGGVYQTWNIKGNVQIQVVSTGGANAVVNGIFFDTPPSASASGQFVASRF